MFSKKGILENFAKLRKKHVSESDKGFLLSVLRNFWEHFFTEHFRVTAFDEET